jgi:periplasmic divalent cation tolerance protein
MKEEFSVVMATCGSIDEAKTIIDALLDEKLAACIQTIKIDSHYIWKGDVCRDSEILLLIKTKKELFEEIKNTICKNHSYEVPEIILLPIEDGYPPYLAWISEVCK